MFAACGTDGRGFEPRTSTNACGHVCRYVDLKGLAVKLTSNAVSRCLTRGESEDYTSEKACKNGSTLALKPRAEFSRSPKTGVSSPTKETYVLQKFFKKREALVY